MVDTLQFSYVLPGSGLLDPILTLNFPTKRDLYNLKGTRGGEERKKNKTKTSYTSKKTILVSGGFLNLKISYTLKVGKVPIATIKF